VLITPYLLGRVFRTELTVKMSTVLERVCSKLQLRLYDLKHGSKVEVIAAKIIGLAQRGVTDEDHCYRVVMVELAQELREENERLVRRALKLIEKLDALQKIRVDAATVAFNPVHGPCR
jgi:hypothetical protein